MGLEKFETFHHSGEQSMAKVKSWSNKFYFLKVKLAGHSICNYFYQSILKGCSTITRFTLGLCDIRIHLLVSHIVHNNVSGYIAVAGFRATPLPAS